MSGLRHHLLSLTAAGLGVTLGLGLGAGPVAEETVASHERTTARLTERAERLQDRVDRLGKATADGDKAVRALAARLTTRRLDGRSVVVVAAPGASGAVVRRVVADLAAAGATVTGELTLTRTYVDPAQAQSPLEDLALRLVPPGVEFVEGSSAIERVGTVLARATVRRPTEGPRPAGIDQDAAGLIAGLEELDAAHLEGTPGRLADLAVLVSADGGADARTAEPALAGLLTALDAGSLGAVLAGTGAAAEGAMRWVRSATNDQLEGGISTVDSLERPIGRAVLVLALAEQAQGRAGHYGLGRDARAVLPVDGPGD